MASKRPSFIILVLFLVVVNFFLWQEVLSWDGCLHTIFFDVGQGDAIFFETPQGHQILIDGGPNKDLILKKLTQEMPFWDRSLDLIILTHPDYDHLAGLVSVLEHYDVANIFWTGAERETRTFQKWQTALNKENASMVLAQQGQTITAGNLVFYVLYPAKPFQGQLFDNDSNDTSIVAKAVYGKNSFLLPGDIQEDVEEQLVEKTDLTAQVLKLAHHGSKSSTSIGFLEAVRPWLAVISVGRNNPYLHPNTLVLQNLQKFGIKVLRTDLNGDVEAVSNGEILRIR